MVDMIWIRPEYKSLLPRPGIWLLFSMQTTHAHKYNANRSCKYDGTDSDSDAQFRVVQKSQENPYRKYTRWWKGRTVTNQIHQWSYHVCFCSHRKKKIYGRKWETKMNSNRIYLHKSIDSKQRIIIHDSNLSNNPKNISYNFPVHKRHWVSAVASWIFDTITLLFFLFLCHRCHIHRQAKSILIRINPWFSMIMLSTSWRRHPPICITSNYYLSALRLILFCLWSNGARRQSHKDEEDEGRVRERVKTHHIAIHTHTNNLLLSSVPVFHPPTDCASCRIRFS